MELPPNFTWVLLLNGLLLADGAAQLLGGREETLQPSFQVIVSCSEARFGVPISPRDPENGTGMTKKDRRRDYAMEVLVGNSGNYYRFGFYLFKKPGSTPKDGDLTALLTAGQQRLFSGLGEGGRCPTGWHEQGSRRSSL